MNQKAYNGKKNPLHSLYGQKNSTKYNIISLVTFLEFELK